MCQNSCHCGKHDPQKIVTLMPGLDCGKCGYITCLEFASSLCARNSEVEDCFPLLSPHNTVALLRLRMIFEPNG